MTEEAKKKIEQEANWLATNGHGAGDRTTKDSFIRHAEFGYSLASEEIERLKGLLNELYMDYSVLGSAPGTDVNEMWLKYKQKHNL